MRLKSYFAASIESAIGTARNEMGPEAMLVSSRKAPPEGRHLGAYEVVFASETAGAETAREAAAPAPAKAKAAVAAASEAGIAAEVAFLRTQLSALRRELTQAWQPDFGTTPMGHALSRSFTRLLAADVDPATAQRVVKAAQTTLIAEGGRAADCDGAVAGALEDAFTIDAEHGGSSGPSIIVLVGPPGAGKTTVIAKLAVTLGLKARRRTQLLTLDNYRVGAAAQLRSYARIIGVGFETLETAHALAQAIEEYQTRSLILIDTAGCGASDLANYMDLARFLSRRKDVTTHLALPASMKTSDMNRAADTFAIFGVSRLLFTKLDETDTFGPILSLSARTGLPLSYFSSGQRVPEDLEPASKAKLMNLVWSEAARDSELSVA